MIILHYDQLKPKSYLNLIKKYIFSEGEQFPLSVDVIIWHGLSVLLIPTDPGRTFTLTYVNCLLLSDDPQQWREM